MVDDSWPRVPFTGHSGKPEGAPKPREGRKILAASVS